MATRVDTKIEEAQIHQLLEDWGKAVDAKDIEGVMACYAPGIVAFDAMPPLRCVGAEAYRKNWELGFEMCDGHGEFETRDMNLAVGGDVAFCHRLNHMTGTDPDGKEFDCWIRWTVCFQKMHGKWLIAHEHISAPIDMETNQGRMDLKP